MTQSETESLCAKILGLVKADGAELYISDSEDLLLRSANNDITSNGLIISLAIGLAVSFGKRSASISINQTDDDTLRPAVTKGEAMAKALCQLAEQPQLAARMGVAGRSAVDARFSMQAMVDAYHRLYSGELRRAKWAGECA